MHVTRSFVFFFLLGATAFVHGQTASEIRRHWEALAHDSTMGRGAGTVGENRAAGYIASQLQASGVRTLPSMRSYVQSVPMHASATLPSSRLKLEDADTTVQFEYLRDYVMLSTGAQTYIPQPTPLVFVGFGIVAPEYDHNDYQGVEVKGKIAVILDGEPASTADQYFDGSRPTVHSFHATKRKTALARGARGSIILSWSPTVGTRNWRTTIQEYLHEDVSLNYEPAGHFSVLMNANAARVLFGDGEASLRDILLNAASGSVSSFDLAGRISFHGEFSERDFLSQNVIGMVEGSQMRDSYVLVTAHYDHLGIGPVVDGDSIYNGAFDNAIGVATVLALAREIAKHPLRRSVIFLFPTGEEKGLLGSLYYCDHAPVPLYRTAFAVNVDGVSVFERVRSVFAIGAEWSDLEARIENILRAKNIRVAAGQADHSYAEAFYRSDQYAFAQAGIPSVLMMEGPDYERSTREEGAERQRLWYETFYHSPRDDTRQVIDADALEQYTDLLQHVIRSLGDDPREVQWKPGVSYLRTRLQTAAEQR